MWFIPNVVCPDRRGDTFFGCDNYKLTHSTCEMIVLQQTQLLLLRPFLRLVVVVVVVHEVVVSIVVHPTIMDQRIDG